MSHIIYVFAIQFQIDMLATDHKFHIEFLG
jgi:hypothetical protein